MVRSPRARKPPALPKAICQIALPEEGPPDWVELIPAGVDVHAVDGRKFKNPNPQAVVEAFARSHTDIPLDWEHATEKKAPKGEEAPAAGWIVELQVRDGGAIWGRVNWNARGAASVSSKEYRYISPAFHHGKAGDIQEIVSAGLTNRPALRLAELAQYQGDSMDPELLKMLGLSEGATPQDVAAAVKALKDKATEAMSEMEKAKAEASEKEKELAEARSRNPGLDKFVPRADFDAAQARVKTLEEKMATAARESLEATISVEIDAALKSGKITPATKDFYVATCRADGGLEKFREFVKAAPTIASPEPLIEGKPPGADKVALTAQEREACATMGITEDEYRAAAAL